MVTLTPEYKRTVEYVNGYNADIQHVLEKNFIAARRSVEKNDFYKQFEGRNLKDTCRNVWNYLKENVNYKEDGPIEQKIKMPPRLFADKEGDCKSLSLAAIAICSHFADCKFRYTSYRNDPTPTHVYIIVGDKYIIDAVWFRFNEEKPYTYKFDKRMKISTLSGLRNPIKIDPTYYTAISFFDTARKKYPAGSENRKLLDLYWSAYAKKAIDKAKKVSDIDLTVSSEADKIYNKALLKANKLHNIPVHGIGKKGYPDWTTRKDRVLHDLSTLDPLQTASRAAFLGLSELNAFGIIDKLLAEEASNPHKITRIWFRLGGDPDILIKHLEKNKKHKPFFGIDQRIKKVIDKIKSKVGIHGGDDETVVLGQVVAAGATATGSAAVLATIEAAIPTILALATAGIDIFQKVQVVKAGGTLPTAPPTNEPPPTAFDTNKILLYGGIGLAVAGSIYYFTKNKNK
jgi:hypothetical protein